MGRAEGDFSSAARDDATAHFAVGQRGRALRLDPRERVSAKKAAKENTFRASLIKGPVLALSCSAYRSVYRNRSLERGGLELAHDIAKRLKKFFSPAQIAAIEALRDARNMTYLHIRGMPLTHSFRYPEVGAEFGTPAFEEQFDLTDFIAAGILHLLRSECKSRWLVPGPPVVRTIVTAPADAQVGDRDGLDMALRFHQSTVERKLIGVAGPETCTFKVYACLRNRRRIPIYLLRVSDVIAAFQPDEREFALGQLQRTAFVKSGPKYDLVDTGEIQENQPILLNVGTQEDPDWLMSFDPERVRTDDDDAKKAIRMLRLAIFAARPTARRISIEEGDFLMVDNMRVLVSRREYDPKGLREIASAIFFRKNTKMLRQYYGFPAPDVRSSKKHDRSG